MKVQTLRALAASAIAATVATAAALPAQALDLNPNEFVFEFSYKRSDLATSQGAEEVYRDLRTEAVRACTRRGNRPLDMSFDRRCMRRLVNDVVARIDAPILTARHEGGAATPTPTRTAQTELASR